MGGVECEVKVGVKMSVTCVDGHPLTGRAGTGAPFSPYSDAVPVATLQAPGCAGGVWRGAAHTVGQVESLSCGVIHQDAITTSPGDLS